MSWFQFSLPDFNYAFLSILLEGVPFLLAGAVLSGLLEEFLPPTMMTRWMPRKSGPAILVSGLLGLVFPICECGIVPVIRRLIRKGLPESSAITYMLAAPIVNPLVILSTLAAFRGQGAQEMTVLRLILGYTVAVLAGFAVQHLPLGSILRIGTIPQATDAEKGSTEELFSERQTRCLVRRLQDASRIASSDFLDVAVFFILGAAAAALFSTSVNQEIILPLASNNILATFSMMGLAAVLSVCSTSDAFIAATFTTFPAIAKLAFLVFGPMVDCKLLFMYSAAFNKRFTIGLALGLFVVIGLLCVRIGAFL